MCDLGNIVFRGDEHENKKIKNTIMTDFIEIIFGRRSIRAYKDKPVDDATVEQILEAAMAAPSAVAKDPWRFIVVREKATLQRISDGLPNGKMLAKAPIGLVVCGDINAAHGNELSYMLQDCSAAIQNLLLATHVNGLGACWLGVHPRMERVAHIQNVFQLPENIIPIASIAIGYPDEQKEPRTRYKEQYVHYERW